MCLFPYVSFVYWMMLAGAGCVLRGQSLMFQIRLIKVTIGNRRHPLVLIVRLEFVVDTLFLLVSGLTSAAFAVTTAHVGRCLLVVILVWEKALCHIGMLLFLVKRSR